MAPRDHLRVVIVFFGRRGGVGGWIGQYILRRKTGHREPIFYTSHGHPPVTYQSPASHLPVTCQSPASHPPVTRQSPVSHPAVAERLCCPPKCERQSSGGARSGICRSAYVCSEAACRLRMADCRPGIIGDCATPVRTS